MPELMPQGPQPGQLKRWTLVEKKVTLGGKPSSPADWVVEWDLMMHRQHAELTWSAGRLTVKACAGTRNPILYQSERFLDGGEFVAGVGEQFHIGDTTFSILDRQVLSVASDLLPGLGTETLALEGEALRRYKYPDPDLRIRVLSRLPELIRCCSNDTQLETRVAEMLLAGIPRAQVAGVVRLWPDGSGGSVEVEQRALVSGAEVAEQLPFSRRQLEYAVRQRKRGVLHRWDQQAPGQEKFSLLANFDWALCAPAPDDPHPGFALFAAGRLGGAVPLAPANLLEGDLMFAELVAEIFGAIRQMRYLQDRDAVLSLLLARSVQNLLSQENRDEVLQARQTDVTVLFCDLRGFSRATEQAQDDLEAAWARVSAALGIMTSGILDLGGVVGDFQGDAAMGFWGWPQSVPPVPIKDQVRDAALAALNISRKFARARKPDRSNPLAGFPCGIGLGTGPAIAGKLDIAEMIKMGVFGPVVNRTARLEGLTKVFRVPILVDEETTKHLAEALARDQARLRKVARVQPAGMTQVLTISELLPPKGEPGALSEDQRTSYETALTAFLEERWDDARRQLNRMSPDDGPAAFLKAFMERHGGKPPAGWNGVIVFETK